MNTLNGSDLGLARSTKYSTGQGCPFVTVPPSMLLRDVIYTMNEFFTTSAAIVSRQGHIIGWLTQSLLNEHFARDADEALRSPCYTLLGHSEDGLAA